jgi:hypothetical protein
MTGLEDSSLRARSEAEGEAIQGPHDMESLAWLEQTDLSIWLRESDWGFPIMLCFHAVGMALVVGISLMFSARVLGYARDFPLSAFDKLFGIAWLGFGINAISGTLLFIGEPRRLIQTPAFLVKLGLIVCAGFSLWFLMTTLYGMEAPAAEPGLSREPAVTLGARIAAIVPIVFWVGAIVTGRLIGYTIAPPPE